MDAQNEIERIAHMVDVLEISSTPQLDAITVYWHNYEAGRGSVTVTCYGNAWTAYFGAISGRTIQEFFTAADTGYLVNKLGITQWLKQTKRHERYVARIVDAIKSKLQAKADSLGGE